MGIRRSLRPLGHRRRAVRITDIGQVIALELNERINRALVRYILRRCPLQGLTNGTDPSGYQGNPPNRAAIACLGTADGE